MGQIDLFKNDSYLIGPCAKRKTSEETLTQVYKCMHAMNAIS